jgi:hypothetical protein
MEYASDFRASPDARHAYAAEAETDSISIFDISQGADKAKRQERLEDAQRLVVRRSQLHHLHEVDESLHRHQLVLLLTQHLRLQRTVKLKVVAQVQVEDRQY